MDIGLIVSFAGVLVAGLAGILGVWMERDPGSPKLWGFVFSGLIIVASGVEANNTYGDTTEAAQTDAKMAVVLEAMAELAEKGDNPALQQFVGAELAVQARANPEVVKKMEKSIAKKGGDPDKIKATAAAGRRMAAGLPASKPKAGERPVLRTPGSGMKARGKAGMGMGRGKAGMGRGKAGGPGGMMGRGKAGGGMGMGAGAGKAVGGKAGPAAGRALGGAAGAVAGPGAGKASKAIGGAGGRAKAGAKAATDAADDAAKAADDAKKAADDAKKSADDAKKEADKAKDAAKKKIPGGLGR